MDPIADMLTSVMNAQRAGKPRVVVPHSRFKKELLEFMVRKGVIDHVRVQDSSRAKLVVTLKYNEAKKPIIQGVRRISKPGQRVYTTPSRLPYTYQHIGFMVISTSKGLIDDTQARREKVGGELICAIW